jgi:hypothetical protein
MGEGSMTVGLESGGVALSENSAESAFTGELGRGSGLFVGSLRNERLRQCVDLAQ